MIPETGKLVPGRPPANSSEAKMTTASSRTTFRMLTHMGAGVELIPSCTRRAPLLENHGHCHDQAEQQGEVVVAGVRADLGQVPCTDRRETLRNRHRVRIPDDLVTAAEAQHSGERDDEGRNADVGHPETLPGSDQDDAEAAE